MLTLPTSTRILLHREPVDFRKAHDGLAAIVRADLKENPLSGDLFVFLNRGCNKVKLLHWDGNGLWLHYKRLEKGTFECLHAEHDDSAVRIDRAKLAMLLEGIDVKKSKFRRHYARSIRIDSGDGRSRNGTRKDRERPEGT